MYIYNIFIYMCIYMYMYIYINTYIYMHIYLIPDPLPGIIRSEWFKIYAKMGINNKKKKIIHV